MVYQSQGIDIQHFDSQTGLPLDLTEKFKHTVAEYLFPGIEFKLGTVYDQTTPKELESFEEQTLQFANGKKFYFASDDSVRDQLFPTASDGAAYGSLPFTQCQNFTEAENLRVLVINDSTGENNVNLDPDYAKTLVGDCYCRIDTRLHELVGGQENTPFQFRLGIRPQTDSPVARLAKGTASPLDLSNIGEGYDLILATSAFKGRKTAENNALVPGEYNLTVGVGLKSHAYYGTHSLGPQVLVNYPEGVAKDIVPLVEKELELLKEIALDPLAIAQDFLKSTEERYKYRVLDQLELLETDLSPDDLDAVMELVNEQNNEVIYKLLKEDISNHRQLLEHPKIINALNDHLQNRYREIATGRFVKFKGALLQPHHNLKDDEFCDPNLKEGEELIVTRSPLVNSNGVIILRNTHLEDVSHLKGTVYMNPSTAAAYLQGDFDGDRVAYQLGSKYPNLTAEIKAKHLPENRYAEIEKRQKTAYTGTFAEIALSAKDNQIGIIATRVMKAIALEMELENLPKKEVPQYINNLSNHFNLLEQTNKKTGEIPDAFKGKEELIFTLQSLADSNQSVDEKLGLVKKFLHDRVDDLAQELQVAVDGPKSADRPNPLILMANNMLMAYREVEWLKNYKAKETYLEQPLSSNTYSPVDLMVRPVNEIWSENRLEPRQNHQFQNLFNGANLSQDELHWAQQVKQTYNKLNSSAFRLKNEYSEAPGPRLILTTEQEQQFPTIDQGQQFPTIDQEQQFPTTDQGQQFHIIHTLESNHPQTYSLNEMNIYFRKNDGKLHPELKYSVFAEVSGEVNQYGKPQFLRIGFLSKISEQQQQQWLKENLKSSSNRTPSIKTQVTVIPGVTPNQIQAAFSQVREFCDQTYEKIPAPERLDKAAALWEVTHRRQAREKNELGQWDNQQRFNKGTAAFAIFGAEINQQLQTLQFNQIKIAGINTPGSEFGLPPQNTPFPIYISLEDNPRSPQFGKRALFVTGEKGGRIGYIPEDEPQLPIATTATATFSYEQAKTLQATLDNGQILTVGHLINYQYATTSFENIPTTLEITSAVPNGRTKEVPGVLLNGQMLGLITNKDSQTVLSSLGLVKGKTFEATLNRGYYESTVMATLDPDTVNYSDGYLTNKALLPSLQGEIKKQDSLVTLEDNNNIIRLGINHNKRQQFAQYFQQNNIPFNWVNSHTEAGLEYELGLLVLTFERETVSEQLWNNLVSIWGEPLSKEAYSTKLQEIAQQPLEFDQLIKTKQSNNYQPIDPYQLVPKSSNFSIEKNRIKDREMAGIATQFIGFPAQTDPNQISSTRDYQKNWNTVGLANTGNYRSDDIIMISGSGPWRGVTQEQITKTFEQKYKPLLEKAISAKASFVVGNALGNDQLVVNYLKQQGYQLTLKNNYYSANSLEQNHSPINLASNFSEKENDSPLQKTTNTNMNNELKDNQLISNSAANKPQRLLPIVGKPIAMNYSLRLHGENNLLPVNTTIEAMRGLGRNHTTRTFEPYQIYGFKEGDLALAYSGKKENPTQQVLIRVGKQYKITSEMINDPQYRQHWANSEKHNVKELDSFKGQQSWGLEYEPIGDYRKGKVYDFQSGEDITSMILSSSHNNKSTHQIQLTPQQQEGFDKMKDWLYLPRNLLQNNMFCLEGYAGTGKSFTVTHFVETAKKDFPGLTIAYTGPTHEAVNVGRQLSEKLNIRFDDIRTLHSLLKYRPGINYKKNEVNFQGGKFDDDEIMKLPDLIIVDEVSMVNKEMFSLLKELAQRSKKILLVGDRAQIRPVKEERSLAFTDPDITHRVQLTEVVRYSNQLGYLATALRTDQTERKPLIVSSCDQTVIGQNESDWLNNILGHFTSEDFQKNPNYFQVYAYTNARVDELNEKIRTARFGNNAPEYVEGEIIVANDNGQDQDQIISIYNGQEMKVLEATKLPSEQNEDRFETWLLKVESLGSKDNSFYLRVVAQESKEAFQNQLKKLEISWKSETNKARKSQKYKEKESFQKKYNDLSYNYARTYHKAQGKTKVKVAIDQQNLNEVFGQQIESANTDTKRKELIQQMQELTYVASTRASEKLFVYNQRATISTQEKPWYLPDTEWERSKSLTASNSEQPDKNPPSLTASNSEQPDKTPPSLKASNSEQLEKNPPSLTASNSEKSDENPPSLTASNSEKSDENSPSLTASNSPTHSELDVLNSISTYLSSEFMPENIAIQQQRTSQVAPVLLALLQAKRLSEPDKLNWNEKTQTLSYRGQENTIFWDGKQLTLATNDGHIKMIAQGKKNDKDITWKAINLPLNSPGLTKSDVDFFTNPQIVNSIKQTIVEQSQKSAVKAI